MKNRQERNSVKLGLIKLNCNDENLIKNRINITENVKNCLLGNMEHDTFSIKWLVSFSSSKFNACLKFDNGETINIYNKDSTIIISIPINKVEFCKDDLLRTIEVNNRIIQFTDWVEGQWMERCGK